MFFFDVCAVFDLTLMTVTFGARIHNRVADLVFFRGGGGVIHPTVDVRRAAALGLFLKEILNGIKRFLKGILKAMQLLGVTPPPSTQVPRQIICNPAI